MIQTSEVLDKLFKDFYKKLESLGMRQQEAADELGVTRSHLNKVINGRTDPSLKLVKALENFCYRSNKEMEN